MRRWLMVLCLTGAGILCLGARACVEAPVKVDAPVKADVSVAKTEAPISDDSTTATDMQTLAWDVKEISNTVHNTKSVVQNIGDPKSLILLMMLMQGVQMLRDFAKDFLTKKK